MRHVPATVFACLVYALSIATAMYAVAFFGNLYMPRTIDSPALVPVGGAITTDIALLVAFGLQHVGMARPAFRRRLRRFVPGYAERSIHVFVSCVSMIALMAFWQPLGDIVWELEVPAMVLLAQGLFLAGCLIMIAATFVVDHLALFGLRQVLDVDRGIPRRTPTLTTVGPYRVVRHPIYLGWLLVLWAAPFMTVTHLVAVAGLTLCIVVGASLGERELTRAVPGFAQYRRKVPMLIPSFTRHLALRTKTAVDAENG